MSYYDDPSLAQRVKLAETLGDPYCTFLIEWGCERLSRGETLGMTNGLWTIGKFSEFISIALDNRTFAQQLVIATLARDYIRVMNPHL